MHHLKPFPAARDQINHLLLLKFFVKKLNVPNLNQFIAASKRSLYRSQINQHSNNPRNLWPIMNLLLSRTLPQSLPTFSSASNLTTSFLNFFTDKITKLSASFPSVPLI